MARSLNKTVVIVSYDGVSTTLVEFPQRLADTCSRAGMRLGMLIL